MAALGGKRTLASCGAVIRPPKRAQAGKFQIIRHDRVCSAVRLEQIACAPCVGVDCLWQFLQLLPLKAPPPQRPPSSATRRTIGVETRFRWRQPLSIRRARLSYGQYRHRRDQRSSFVRIRKTSAAVTYSGPILLNLRSSPAQPRSHPRSPFFGASTPRQGSDWRLWTSLSVGGATSIQFTWSVRRQPLSASNSKQKLNSLAASS